MASPAAYAQYYKAAAQRYGIPPSTLAGLVTIESGGNPNARSPVGAQGLTQFMPGTAKSYGVQFGSSPAAIQSQVLGAARYLSDLGYAKNPGLALSSYNAGPGNPGAAGPYAANVLAAAKKYAYLDRGGGGTSPLPSAPGSAGGPQNVSTTVPTFNQAGFQKATKAFVAGNFLSHQAGPYDTGGSGSNPLFSSGLLTTTAPNPQDFQGTKTVQVAQSNLQRLAGGNVLNAHPALQQASKGLSNIAAGFLPKGAQYIVGRKDQGRDGQTNPGGPILANGNGVVLSVKSDPNGFGPSYAVVHFTSGRFAGRTLYFGHTLAAVRPGQRVAPGQVIARTGTTGIGNATVPGWFEIGFADSGSPGPMGQAVPF